MVKMTVKMMDALTLRHGITAMVTTAVLIVHDGAKMAQQGLDKNGLWGPNSNILKITVACVEKMMVKMTVKMMDALTLRHGITVMVTTAVLIVHDGAKMAQQELDKNGLWGRNLNILKVTVAYVEKMVVKMMVKM